jgi:hypothetical protein
MHGMENIKQSQTFGEPQKSAASRSPLASLQYADPIRTTDRQSIVLLVVMIIILRL